MSSVYDLLVLDVRLAEQQEIPLLGQIERRADETFARFPGLLPSDGQTASPELLCEAVEDGRVWVAEAGGVIVGFAFALIVDGQAHLEQLSVVPEERGRGAGTQLLDAVIAWASKRPYRWITLSTFRDVPWNAPFYARRGFEPIAESDVSSGLRSLRLSEVDHGLDVSLRLFMRHRLHRT